MRVYTLIPAAVVGPEECTGGSGHRVPGACVPAWPGPILNIIHTIYTIGIIIVLQENMH